MIPKPTLHSHTSRLLRNQVAPAITQAKFLRQVSAEPNLFGLCRTEQKSAKLNLAKIVATPPHNRQTIRTKDKRAAANSGLA